MLHDPRTTGAAWFQQRDPRGVIPARASAPIPVGAPHDAGFLHLNLIVEATAVEDAPLAVRLGAGPWAVRLTVDLGRQEPEGFISGTRGGGLAPSPVRMASDQSGAQPVR